VGVVDYLTLSHVSKAICGAPTVSSIWLYFNAGTNVAMVVIALKATNPNHHFDPRMPAIVGRMIATLSIPLQKKSPCGPKREFVRFGARIPNQNSTKGVPPNKPQAVFR
jgi:hypothetical protein